MSTGRELEFVPFHLLDGRPNVIVDGAATTGTTVALSHWPGTVVPSGLEADLSAEMAFAYLDRWDLHGAATLVSNNHFDQDGLVSVFALAHPEEASDRRRLLIDVAAAGDFATYRDRTAARVSMVIAAFADQHRTPLGEPAAAYETWCGQLYEELLGRLPELCDHPDRYRGLWAEEDEALTSSEALVRSGDVHMEEVPELDLAVVTVPSGAPSSGGHRFGSRWATGLHPMAVNTATAMFGVLTVSGASFDFVYRYESWVQYRTRRPRSRVDLGPLAAELTAEETSGGWWTFDGVEDLEPRLHLEGAAGSTISPAMFRQHLEHHLRTGVGAWDPYQPRS